MLHHATFYRPGIFTYIQGKFHQDYIVHFFSFTRRAFILKFPLFLSLLVFRNRRRHY